MEHYKSDAKYKRLVEKVRLVEKSGQTASVHHDNLVKYIEAENAKLAEAKAKASKAKKETEGKLNDGKSNG